MHTYHGSYNSFPAGVIERPPVGDDGSDPPPPIYHGMAVTGQVLPNGSTMGDCSATTQGIAISNYWGWHAMLLPQLDQGPTYRLINFGANTNLPRFPGQNAAAAFTVPSYVCPSASMVPTRTDTADCTGFADNPTGDYGQSNYVGSAGVRTLVEGPDGSMVNDRVGGMFGPNMATRFRDVDTDGTVNTILLIESLYGVWAEGYHCCTSYDPDDGGSGSGNGPIFSPGVAGAGVGAVDGRNVFTRPGAWHAEGCNVALVDGSSRLMNYSIDQQTYARLIQRNDGQQINSEW